MTAAGLSLQTTVTHSEIQDLTWKVYNQGRFIAPISKCEHNTFAFSCLVYFVKFAVFHFIHFPANDRISFLIVEQHTTVDVHSALTSTHLLIDTLVNSILWLLRIEL